ncbi:MAG: DUF2264 domain-containing protein [Firmicutes bacterium]|nr:DUF2264 domain-containing protein [Bacillota bacterium]
MHFEAATKDWQKSPITGMTRQSWIEAGKYLLEGAFSKITSIEEPMIVPRSEFAITYPHQGIPSSQLEREKRAEEFEGLTRTFFIGCMLIRNDPDTLIHGIRITDYYARQILRATDPDDPLFVGSYEQMQALSGEHRNDICFQQTVETCALVIGLWACREQIWERYSKKDQDQIAAFLQDWAIHATVPQNWRLFNMLDLAFLYQNGYPIDSSLMAEHAAAILHYSVGDGWYRDGQSFDYYSAWAFNTYTPLWCAWYGYEKMPELAAAFEKQSNLLMQTYPDFFDADGWTNMWGRSGIYRCGAVSPLAANFFLSHPAANPGLARRIASGSLLQFLSRDDFLVDGVPSIGFYGPFSPLVQPYSCAESVYWLGKAFLCLYFPEDHPFWSATEQAGTFSDKTGPVKVTVLDGPGLCTSNHPANGETLLRTGKVVKDASDTRSMWAYGKLCYSTKYPWEAVSVSEQYELTYEESGRECSRIPNALFYCGPKKEVLYRRAFFSLSTGTEMHWLDAMDLADFPVAEGILRCDRIRLCHRPSRLTLGSFGFPDNETTVQTKEGPNGEKAMILKGTDAMGQPRQLAMTIFAGWQDLSLMQGTGTNPDSAKSLILAASVRYQHHYDAAEPHVLLSQVLTREDGKDFTEEELFPIEKIDWEDPWQSGVYGAVTLHMRDGLIHRIDYTGIEARLTI